MKINLFFPILHPGKALGLIRQGAEDATALAFCRNQLEEERFRSRELLARNEHLTSERDDANRILGETRLSVDMLTKQVVSLRRQLDDLKDTNRRVDEMMSQLEKVEELKASYEKRIKNLQARISNLQALTDADSSILDEPKPIRISSSSISGSSSGESSGNPGHADSADDADWLQHL